MSTGPPETRPDKPDVTVICPVFNQEAYVADAIRSVANQSTSNWECLVVDDGSEDSSLATALETIADDKRFRVLRHKVNRGLSAARNTGICYARGEMLAFLDADDLLMAESLEDRLRTIKAHERESYVAGVFCGVAYGREDVQLEGLPPSQDWAQDDPERRIVDFISAGGECPFPVHAPLVRRDVVERLGGFDESLTHGGEDWQLWQRVLRNGYIFMPSDKRSALYRQRSGSMIRSAANEHVSVALQLIDDAYREVDPSVLTAPTDTPMHESLASYNRRISQAKRTIRFAAIAHASGHHSQSRETLTSLAGLADSVLRRHVDVKDEYIRGFKRSRGYVARDLGPLESEIKRSWPSFDESITEAVDGWDLAKSFSSPSIEALLVPTDPAQEASMIDAATAAGHDFRVIDTSTETGMRGIGMRQEHRISLNSLALRPLAVGKVITGIARDAHSSAVVTAAIRSGARLQIVDDDRSTVLADAHADGISTNAQHRERVPLEQALREILREGPPDELSSLWMKEEDATSADFSVLRELRGTYAGERCVIIGNGPSLNNTDLTRLQSEFTFAVNGIFYAHERMGFDPNIYVVEDTAFMRDNLEEIKRYRAGLKLFPTIYRDQVGDAEGTGFFTMNRGFYERSSPNYCVPRFATDVTRQIFSGQSVTYINLQLAYHMGFSEVILLGMDFSYLVPESAEVSGDRIVSNDADPNHFHPDYFGKGKVWKDPKLERVKAAYSLAKRVFDADGREIVNATIGGELEVFRRVAFGKVFT